MTQAEVNQGLVLLGLVLQIGLLALVFRRGVWRVLPGFTVLLVFHPVRAAAMLILFGHMGVAEYVGLARGLEMVGLLLQMVVAVEIGWTIGREGRRGWLLLLVPVVGWLVVMAIWDVLPEHSPVPVDRVQMLVSVMMILLLGWAVAVRASILVGRVVLGLAVYGVVYLVSAAEKSVAAAARDVERFREWSYASTVAYLVVVLFWVWGLRAATERYDRIALTPGN
jgi:hypothetical protein